MPQTSLRYYLACLLASSLLLTACVEQGVILNKPPGVGAISRFTGNPAKLQSITLRVSQLTQLEQGQTAQLEVVALDSDGNLIDPNLLNLDWKAENGSAIQIDENGVVTGLLPVSASNVTVTDLNTQVSDTGQVVVTGPFTGDPALLDKLFFAFPNQTLIKAGDSVPYILIAVDTQGRPIDPAKLGEIKWAVADTTRFKIDANGVVTALTDGTAAAVTGMSQVTATASGKQALGTVDMLHGSGQGTPPSPGQSTPPSSEPSPSVSVAPTVVPSIAPTVTPSVSPTPTVAPSATPTPVLTGNPSNLVRLIISPSVNTFDGKGDSANFFVQAVDNAGNFIDPATLTLVWSTDKPLVFLVQGAGKDCKVIADDNSGFGQLTVTDQGSGIKATAELHIGSGGGSGGGGGSTPAAAVLSEPVIDEAGFMYAGGDDGKIHAFDNEGDPVWTFQADGDIVRNPAATGGVQQEEYRLYFGTEEGSLYGVDFEEGNEGNVDGVQAWKIDVGSEVTTAPLVRENRDGGIIVVGAADGMLHAYTLDGANNREPLWERDPDVESSAPLRSSPIMNGNGHIVVATPGGDLCSINADTGFIIECDPLNSDFPNTPVVADPVFAGENRILVPSQDGNLYLFSIDSQGELGSNDFVDISDAFDTTSETPLNNSVAVDNNDGNSTIYAPAGRDLVAIDFFPNFPFMFTPSGWKTTVCESGETIVGAPLVSNAGARADKLVYVTCTDGNLYSLNATNGEEVDGVVVDKQEIEGRASDLVAGPAFLPGDPGTVVVGGPDGKMQLFETDEFFTATEGDNFWPKFRYDQFNSGFYPFGPCCSSPT
ncbi:MAG: PQQ-binding-like beta-propeller repeat protein [Candidatus Sericytochromatia bacterium]